MALERVGAENHLERSPAAGRGGRVPWLALASLTLSACVGAVEVYGPAGLSIEPTTYSMAPGGSHPFRCVASGSSDPDCSWSVLEGAVGGGVTSAGVYTAPSNPGTYHLVAASRTDASRRATATVIVAGGDGTSSGGGSSSGGSGSSSSSGGSSGGSSGSGGGSSSGAAVVAVVVTPHTASLVAGESVQLSVRVTGTSNMAVSWTIEEGPAGGGVDGAGRYTAPSTPGTYHVVATSDADAAAKDTATVTVTDPVGTEGDGDFTISSYSVQPELTDRGAPKGRQFTFTMDSTKSVIFDGKDPTLSPSKPRSLTRQIWVYVPARYVDGTPAPILVIQDGPGPLTEISRALDNMTGATDPARRIPPFVAIAVQNGGNDAQGSERGLEYDTLSDRYARFIQLEVLPAVLADAQIKAAYPGLTFTDDPEGKATYGCSSGAAAAFTMAWFRPDLFRRVLSYSGTFVAQQNTGQPESTVYPLGAWEYHSSKKLIAAAAQKPLRVFLNVNEFDLRSGDPESTYHNWVMANQRTAAALKEKGYHDRFVLAKGLGHCDAKAMQATLADALAWLWRGYR
jgi:enterochelin esterase-like enzyme